MSDLTFAAEAPGAPLLPPGSEIEIPDLGTVFVRDIPGPAGAPTVILLHGWTATADLNFFTCYAALAEQFRVIAYDHRGHGRGLRTRRAFQLEDAADDVAAIATALGVDTFTPVGYSMGGPIAMLTWKQHRDRVDGLVLCATAAYFSASRPERLSFAGLTGLAALSRYTPNAARDWLTEQLYLSRKSWGPWALDQASKHDWRMILEAGKAIGDFSASDWINEIDVPTANLITLRDQVVPLRRQVKLYEGIPDAQPFRIDGLHDAVVVEADRFVPSLMRAVEHVTRTQRRSATTRSVA